MKIAIIETGKLESVKAAVSARGTWGAYIAELLVEGPNEVPDEIGETLADVAIEVEGLYVACDVHNCLRANPEAGQVAGCDACAVDF